MTAGNHFIKYIILGNVFLALGLLLNYALPDVINKVIDTQIALTQSSQTFPMWKEPPVPVYQKFYFFNVTNAQEVEQSGHKPNLEEIGPFVYRSEWSKKDIENDELKNIMNFKHFKTWHFEPDMSIADHRIQLVTLNAPLAITLTLIQSASNAVRLLVTFSLDGLSEGFFTKRTVKQLLFDGYPDLLTTFGPLLNAEMLSQGGHFGYMNARNNSLDGVYEINTGVDDISKLNTINRYNGRSKLSYWHHHGDNHCNSLEGSTTGEMFPPIKEDQQSIKLFQPDFCRVWRLDYDSKFEQQNTGLRLKRFKATRDVFKNFTDLPSNSCFFSRKSIETYAAQNRVPQPPGGRPPHLGRQGRQQQQAGSPIGGDGNVGQQNNGQNQNSNGNGNGNGSGNSNTNNNNNHNNRHHGGHHNRVRHEWPSGVFTLAPCKFNAPIYMSMPHFLDADPYYGSRVDGLKPDASKHEFYLDLEPRTGAPVTLSARVQLNVAISKPPGLVRFRNVPEIMFPVFWQELSVNLTGPAIDQLYLASRGAQEINERISYVFFMLGLAILITTIMFYIRSATVAPAK